MNDETTTSNSASNEELGYVNEVTSNIKQTNGLQVKNILQAIVGIL